MDKVYIVTLLAVFSSSKKFKEGRGVRRNDEKRIVTCITPNKDDAEKEKERIVNLLKSKGFNVRFIENEYECEDLRGHGFCFIPYIEEREVCACSTENFIDEVIGIYKDFLNALTEDYNRKKKRYG